MRNLLPAVLGLILSLAGGRAEAPRVSRSASPIGYFRELLVMTEDELAEALADRPEAQRDALRAKVFEYASMSANDRELRLRATELRHYLLPLMRVSIEEREQRLPSVPEDVRDLVESRLVQWSLIPPPFQQQLLDNQAALLLFSRMHPESPSSADELVGRMPAERVADMSQDMARWQELSPADQARLLKGFNHFFELTPAEQARTLRTLSPEERLAMDKTLKQFDALAPAQRDACIRGFQQFVLMPPSERARFLKNADRWQAMTPEEREQWRVAVDRISRMPPLPPGVQPVLVHETPPLPVGFMPPEAVVESR